MDVWQNKIRKFRKLAKGWSINVEYENKKEKRKVA